MFVDLGIQHAMRMRRIVNCGLSGSAIFFHFINGTMIYGGGGMFVLIFSICLKPFPF
jgi:hypothetical protein